ncbi:DUF6461 domain-containing protein [Streptomyces sp. NBC_00724]|uniref:DUF6461 domain-containing protein n=1 Tax=Streptomyces sp. NBC_00724 TaxID=2975812 RepID=UPI002ED30CA6|nr:DUF6461 domain-containing protein [Streptomyces sp. NBC_00724]
MTAIAADYVWFNERFPELARAYCITLVRELPPAELLRRLAGRGEPALTGIPALVDAAYELHDRYQGRRTLIALTTIGSWTLMIEPNGYLGVTEEVALPTSRGTRWVSHYDNHDGNTGGTFLWAQDTNQRLHFELDDPGHRTGSTPDELLDVIRHTGFEFPDEPAPTDDYPAASAALALAEHLTQVRLTPELLQNTTFSCGSSETW